MNESFKIRPVTQIQYVYFYIAQKKHRISCRNAFY